MGVDKIIANNNNKRYSPEGGFGDLKGVDRKGQRKIVISR
jgi:hypothetical protein